MYPPSHMCKELYNLHKQLRFSWHGEDKKDSDELNKGSFGIIQLYHISDAGTEDEPNTYYQRWNPAGSHYGPVFNRYGTTSLDYDPLFRVPIYKMNLKDFGVPQEFVFNGAILDVVKWFLTPIKQRTVSTLKEKVKSLKEERREIVEKAGELLWKDAQNNHSNNNAYKHMKHDVKKFYEKKEASEHYLDHMFDPIGI